MRRTVIAASLLLSLATAAQGQTLSGSPIPATVPTLHQFGNAFSSASYLAGQVECGAGALTGSVPIGCVNADWLALNDYDMSLSTFFQIGGTWAAGDKIGVNFWLGTGTGSYTEYPVSYTVQAGDISGSGNSLATYQNILENLVGRDQSGQLNGIAFTPGVDGSGWGCINGTGGYSIGGVPATPSHCSGTNAFLAAMAAFPDAAPVAGNGYRPQAAVSCAGTVNCWAFMDFPWGNAATGGFAAHPAVNVALPTKTSAGGTFTTVQQPAANIQNHLYSSGNTLDNGPILGGYRLTGNSGSNWPAATGFAQRPDVVGDVLTRVDFSEGTIHETVRGAAGQSSASYAAGTTVVLAAAPRMPLSMSLPSGGGANFYVQDATTACAISPGTTLAGWNSGSKTITLSAAVNGTAPCPGIASGDLISITDADTFHDEFAFSPSFSIGPVLFLGDGLRTTGVAGANAACGADPGLGSAWICGDLFIGDGSGALGPLGYGGNLYLNGLSSTTAAGASIVFDDGVSQSEIGAIGTESGVIGNTSPAIVVQSGSANPVKLWGGGRSQTPADLQIGSDGGVTAGNAADKGPGTIDAASGVFAAGVPLLPTLGGTTGSIGGASVGAGACTGGTLSVAGATTGMAVAASPAAYPGDGFGWRGYVSASGTVTVKLCNETAGSLTPTASAYNVRVLQ